MKVRVRLLKDVAGIGEEEEELEMESWQAAVLLRENLAVLAEEMNQLELKRRLIAEERSRELKELPENFLELVSLMRDEEKRASKEVLEELLDTRMRKILSAFPDKPENMLPEEASFFNLCLREFRNWKAEIERVVG